EKMPGAIDALGERLLRLQGDGGYAAASTMADEWGRMDPQLRQDLEKPNRAGIPVDIVFEQGPAVLGLAR
ncbi:MAG: Zn-dependent hydrolase, partial [Acidobacteriota bacterium]